MARIVWGSRRVVTLAQHVTADDVERAIPSCLDWGRNPLFRLTAPAKIAVLARRIGSGRYSFFVHRRMIGPLRPVLAVHYEAADDTSAPRLSYRFRPSCAVLPLVCLLLLGPLAVTAWIFVVALVYRPDVLWFGVASGAFWVVLAALVVGLFQSRLRHDLPHLEAALACLTAAAASGKTGRTSQTLPGSGCGGHER